MQSVHIFSIILKQETLNFHIAKMKTNIGVTNILVGQFDASVANKIYPYVNKIVNVPYPTIDFLDYRNEI